MYHPRNMVKYFSKNINDFEQLEYLDYSDSKCSSGIPFVEYNSGGWISVPFAARANAEENWVEVYDWFGMGQYGDDILPMPIIDFETNKPSTHRINRKTFILKVNPETGDYILKSNVVIPSP